MEIAFPAGQFVVLTEASEAERVLRANMFFPITSFGVNEKLVTTTSRIAIPIARCFFQIFIYIWVKIWIVSILPYKNVECKYLDHHKRVTFSWLFYCGNRKHSYVGSDTIVMIQSVALIEYRECVIYTALLNFEIFLIKNHCFFFLYVPSPYLQKLDLVRLFHWASVLYRRRLNPHPKELPVPLFPLSQ